MNHHTGNGPVRHRIESRIQRAVRIQTGDVGTELAHHRKKVAGDDPLPIRLSRHRRHGSAVDIRIQQFDIAGGCGGPGEGDRVGSGGRPVLGHHPHFDRVHSHIQRQRHARAPGIDIRVGPAIEADGDPGIAFGMRRRDHEVSIAMGHVGGIGNRLRREARQAGIEAQRGEVGIAGDRSRPPNPEAEGSFILVVARDIHRGLTGATIRGSESDRERPTAPGRDRRQGLRAQNKIRGIRTTQGDGVENEIAGTAVGDGERARAGGSGDLDVPEVGAIGRGRRGISIPDVLPVSADGDLRRQIADLDPEDSLVLVVAGDVHLRIADSDHRGGNGHREGRRLARCQCRRTQGAKREVTGIGPRQGHREAGQIRRSRVLEGERLRGGPEEKDARIAQSFVRGSGAGPGEDGDFGPCGEALVVQHRLHQTAVAAVSIAGHTPGADAAGRGQRDAGDLPVRAASHPLAVTEQGPGLALGGAEFEGDFGKFRGAAATRPSDLVGRRNRETLRGRIVEQAGESRPRGGAGTQRGE